MKKIILFLFLMISVLGCKDDDDTSVVPIDNKVLLLKVDFETNTFEEGKELIFETDKDFSITTRYRPPGDFGTIELVYAETEEKIFSGSIIWNGIGAINYPESFIPSSNFKKEDTPLKMPDITIFRHIVYDESYFPEIIEYEKLWEAINSITLLKEYRISNPEAKIYLLPYAPAVGVLDPSLADWIVIVKN
ncbi:hypothetical protein [Aquimarina sp. RZ0]|uniref:hypothetical protein n=1 Tax=Aquimarina sp. RZ0 TaxID=2607730 RepID=UPI0011F2F665|nr:hypothetical protein [Aquimarina sp. RZ0]KAA1248084.1 hypothetical protein F0000_00375 [Aquimarina sp. RZ0]